MLKELYDVVNTIDRLLEGIPAVVENLLDRVGMPLDHDHVTACKEDYKYDDRLKIEFIIADNLEVAERVTQQEQKSLVDDVHSLTFAVDTALEDLCRTIDNIKSLKALCKVYDVEHKED